MAKKKMKISISETVQKKMEVAFDELTSRGADNLDMGDVLSELVQLPEAQSVIDKFVNEKTPESYKINQLLNTPGEREKVLELLRDKSFGLGSSVIQEEPEVTL